MAAQAATQASLSDLHVLSADLVLQTVTRLTIGLTVFVAIFCVGTLQAQDTSDRQKCRTIALKVAASVGGTYELSESGLGARVNLGEPLIGKLFHANVACGPGRFDPHFLSVNFIWRNAVPPVQFWEMAARAGASLAGETPVLVASAVRQCAKKALANPAEEQASIELGNVRVECHHFVRDGGNNTVQIYAVKGVRKD
jgi:hypothetical protein